MWSFFSQFGVHYSCWSNLFEWCLLFSGINKSICISVCIAVCRESYFVQIYQRIGGYPFYQYCILLSAISFVLHNEKLYCIWWSAISFSECNKNYIVQSKMWYLLYYIPTVLFLILFIKTYITNIKF